MATVIISSITVNPKCRFRFMGVCLTSRIRIVFPRLANGMREPMNGGLKLIVESCVASPRTIAVGEDSRVSASFCK